MSTLEGHACRRGHWVRQCGVSKRLVGAFTTEQAARITEAAAEALGIGLHVGAFSDISDERLVESASRIAGIDLHTALYRDPLIGLGPFGRCPRPHLSPVSYPKASPWSPLTLRSRNSARSNVPAIQVAVCGPRNCTDTDATNAEEVGRLLAEAGATVLCGGGAGVMAAVAEGASAAGGLVIGVRPDADRDQTCDGLSAVLYTNMGEARNAILVWSADAVIIIGGSWGTLSELALANRRGGVPVISLGGWTIHDATGASLPAAIEVESARAAVGTALAEATK